MSGEQVCVCVCLCARAHVSDLLSVADVPVPSICNDGVIVAACADTQAVVCEEQPSHSKPQGHVYITGCVCTVRVSPRKSIKLALCNKLKACKGACAAAHFMSCHFWTPARGLIDIQMPMHLSQDRLFSRDKHTWFNNGCKAY